mgnify:CR=1 FL=1|jgi:hypothetical protein
MTPEEFQKRLKAKERELKKFINDDLPRHLGKLAVDHFKDNFRKGGFVNNGLITWDKPKRFSETGITPQKYGTSKCHQRTIQQYQLRCERQYCYYTLRQRIFSNTQLGRNHTQPSASYAKNEKICLGYALPAISQTLYVLFYPHLQGRKDLVGVWLLLGCIDVFSFNPTRFLKPCRMLLSFSSF